MKVATREDISNWAKPVLYDFVTSDQTLQVKLRQLNARDLERILDYGKRTGKTISRPFLIVMSIVNEEGNKLFGEDDIDFIEKNFSVSRMREIGECIERHNGMGENAMEQTEKNSFATLS